MVERNMIREGFVKNTLTVSGTVSGTQTVSLDQIDALVDEDFSTTAITISGGEFVSLDADLGARWKLTRIEYYTDDPTASGITMQISDNNLEYSLVTMTGSPPLYIGDIPDSPITGAPRYIRLTHSGASAIDVQEWRAINDDSLVDFGSDGTQTQIEIDDAPIGKPSDIVETLTLFNRFEKVATGFVFIDTTNTDADDEIQVAANSAGPFFGRTTLDARQPDVTPWEAGEFANTRVVASGAYKVNFQNGSAKGWEGTGFSVATVSGGVFVGTTSSFTPRFQIKNDFVEDTRAEPENRFTFPAKDFDTVNVRLKIPTIDPGTVVEGPRLYWRNQEDDADFDSAKSTLAFTASQTFTGDVRTFTFDVGSVPTWSGTIRGFAIQPYELSAGIGYLLEFQDLEVVHSSEQERVALSFVPVQSGSFPVMDQDLSARELLGALTVINRKNIVQQSCIITKVRGLMSPATAGTTGMFLATISGSADPTVGSNYKIKRVIVISEPTSESGEIDVVVERDVFWPAEPGDVIGASTGAGGPSYIVGNAGDGAFTIGPINVTTTGTAQTAINADTYTISDHNYLLEYEAVAAEDFLANGNYRTPVIDGGTPPALLAVDFQASEPPGTSIDSGGNAFSTLEARASDSPPITALSLGQSTGHFYMFNDWPSVNKPHDFAINTLNGPVTTRDGLLGSTSIQNVAGALLYHELKDELWVLNLLASGTLINFRPTWDVFNVDTGAYIRTQTVAGGLTYAYNHPTTSDFAFEPVGFIADYDREEIYIIQRENAFFVGAGSYYGIVLDLEGNFKDVFMRDGTIGTPSNRLETMGDVAYDGRFFYILTDDTFNGSERDKLMVLRNGTTFDDRDVDFIDEVTISTIPGFSFVSGGNDPKGIAYNNKNGLLYLYFENTSGSQGPTNRKPVIFALQASPNTSDIDDVSSFSFSLTTTSGNAFDSVPFRKGFRLETAKNSTGGDNDDSALITERQLPFTTSLTHISQKDMFGILQTREAIYSADFFAPGQDVVDDFDLFESLSFSFFSGISDGTLSGTITVLPGIANTADFVWGTTSGTLGFETITTDSVLFPTGRYGQVRYTLNASADRSKTPFLTQSQLAQGLRVGDIPANGTRNIFLRTNILGDKSIGDQQGRLKVFWQLSED